MRILTILVLANSVGCLIDLKVPQDARVECTSSANCPNGFECNIEIETCVPTGVDAAPPRVENLVVGEPGPVGDCSSIVCPRVAFRAAQTVVVKFTATEELVRDPEVTLVFPGPTARSLQMSENEDGSYQFEYHVFDDDPNEYATLLVDIVDRFGQSDNISQPLAVRVDTAAPFVSDVQIDYLPARENPRFQVSRLISGTTANVLVQLSEPIIDPVLTAVGPTPFALNLIGVNGLTYAFEYVYAQADAGACTSDNCTYALALSSTDEAGNPVGAIATELVADGLSPDPVQVVSSAVRYHRAPWGKLDVPGVPRFWVEIPSADLDAEDQVAFFTDTSPTNRLEIGVVETRRAGDYLEFELVPQDRPMIAVVRYDAAGNASDAVWLRHQSWYASFAAKDNPSNANEVYVAEGGAQSPRPDISRGLSVPDYSALSDPSTEGVGVPSSFSWYPQLDGDYPPFQTGASGAYDALNGLGLLFGGLAKTQVSNQLWRLDGERWELVQPASAGPSGRFFSLAAFDHIRNRTVFYGGIDILSQVMFNDTWEWDGERWFSIRATPSSPASLQGQLTYDPVRDLTILTGGCNVDFGAGTFDCGTDRMPVWAYDGATWADVVPTVGEHPGLRVGHAAFFDPIAGGIVVTGGCRDSALFACTQYVTDTWLLSASGWSKLGDDVSGDHPSPRFAAVATTDWDLSRGVLYGGTGPDATTDCDLDGVERYCDDLWIWQNGTWSIQGQNSVRPNGPRNPGFFYDKRNHRVTLVDGVLGETGRGTRRTWSFTDVDGWFPLAGEGFKPDGRVSTAAALNRSTGEGVLFGGNCASNYCSAYETHTWVGSAWIMTELPGSNPPDSPGRRKRHRMASAPGGGVVLLGGENTESGSVVFGDFWYWDGTSWTEVCGPNTSACPFSARHSHGLTYDVGRDRVVLFGGKDTVGSDEADAKLGDHWEWNGATWSEPCQSEPSCTEPTGRFGHTLIYDEANGVVLMFGGIDDSGTTSHDAVDELWAYDGTVWSLICGGASGCAGPVGRVYVSAGYDAARGRTVIYSGGTIGNGGPNDLWEWDGTAWTPLNPIGFQPAPRVEHMMLGLDDGLLVFGGDSDTGLDVPSEIWLLDTSPAIRPAMVLRFPLAATQLSDPVSRLRAITVSATAGGTGYTTDLNPAGGLSGDPQPGVALRRWTGTSWALVTDNLADATDPQSLTARLDVQAQVLATLDQDVAVLLLETSTGAGNGPEPAQLQVDFAGGILELEVETP